VAIPENAIQKSTKTLFYEKYTAMKSPIVYQEDEFQTYSQTQKTEDFNILDWWKNLQTILPNLCLMVKDFQGVQASSADSERMFSAMQ
jgi:hypothetical protein